MGGVDAAIVILIVICAVIYGAVSISHIGPANSGQHTGYISSVEQEGWIWKTWRVYVKTDPQSSQEDSYCVEDPTVIQELQDAEENRDLVTVTYSAPYIVFNWQCGGESSIINGVYTGTSGGVLPDGISYTVLPDGTSTSPNDPLNLFPNQSQTGSSTYDGYALPN